MRRPAIQSQPASKRAATAAPARSRLPIWLLALLLVAGTLLAYRPVWHGGWLWDDDIHITQNRLLWEPHGLNRIWFSLDAPQYYPLVFTSFRLEYALWALHPDGYRWVNILLHAASALLVWRVLRRLSVPGAWLAAAVFALHPVNVESVAWISQRKNTLAMVFYLLSLLCYLRFDDWTAQPGSTRNPRPATRPFPSSLFHPPSSFYLLSLTTFVLALLSKIVVAPLPLVLLGLAWWRRGRVTGRDVGRSAPFFGAATILGLVTVWFEHHRNEFPSVMVEESFWSRLAGAGQAVWFYLYKAALPFNLDFIYPQWHINPSSALSYVPGIAAGGNTSALVALSAWLGPARSLLPRLLRGDAAAGLGVPERRFPVLANVADHWQYFAIIAPIALATGALCSRSSVAASPLRLWAGRLVAVLILAALFSLTWRQSARYVDAKTLWSFAVAENPSAWVAHMNLGAALDQQGQADEAIHQLQEAVRLKPDSTDVHNNLGVALARQGQMDEAIKNTTEALRLKPDRAQAHYNLGVALDQQGQTDEAIRHFAQALRFQPGNADACNSCGLALVKKGQIGEAIRQFQEAVHVKPEYAEAHYNLGKALDDTGQIEGAITQFQETIRLKPDYAEAHYNLGNALARKGQTEQAIRQFQETIRLKPDYAEAHYNLGNTFNQRGQMDEAIRQYQETIRLRPDYAEAHNNLGAVFFQQGRAAEAISQFQQALRLKPDYTDARDNLNVALGTNAPSRPVP